MTGPRVASVRPARRLLLALLALCAVLPAAPGRAPEALLAVAAGGGACALAESGPPCACADMRVALRRVLDLPVALATAHSEDLEALSGIGPARARSLLAARESGRLDAVPGIGRATWARLERQLTRGPDPACDLEQPVWRKAPKGQKKGTALPPL